MAWRSGFIIFLLLRLCLAQNFIVPPAANANGAQPANYSISNTLNAKWNCDFQNVNVVLVSEHRAANGAQWNQTLLTNLSHSKNGAIHFDSQVPLTHGSGFRLEVDEVDPSTGNLTGKSFDSAIFYLNSATSAPSTAASTANPTSSAASSASTSASADANVSGGIFPSNMSQGQIIGAGVGMIGTITLIALGITLGIRHRNRNRRQTVLEIDPDHNASGIANFIQKPFPKDPRSPQAISAVYTPYGAGRAFRPEPFPPMIETRRVSMWSASTDPSHIVSPVSSMRSNRSSTAISGVDERPPTPPPKSWIENGWR